MKYPIGSKIRIKGIRDPHAGSEGLVVGIMRARYYSVRILNTNYVKPGRYLKVLELGPEVEVVKPKRENDAKDIDQGYKRYQLKDPKFAEYLDRNNPRVR